jgi:hypothetical protein
VQFDEDVGLGAVRRECGGQLRSERGAGFFVGPVQQAAS